MRLRGHTPLDALQRGEISGVVTALLRSLWVDSVEEAISLTTAIDASGIQGDIIPELKRSLAQATINVPQEVLAPWKKVPVRLDRFKGYNVSPETLNAYRLKGRVEPDTAKRNLSTGKTPFVFANTPLPPSVRLLDKMLTVQQQGPRGTCVAFSVTALREFMAQLNDKLSEQFLYWGCKMIDGGEDEGGTTIQAAMTILREMGICRMETWPYDPVQRRDCEHHGPAPESAIVEAKILTISNALPMAATNINHYKTTLAGTDGNGGVPVAFGVLVFDSWAMSAATYRTGKVTLPLPNESPSGGHAMLAVGYQDDTGVPGGGYLIVRNSWGQDWAADSPEAPGHAMVPYAYVEQCGLEAYSFETTGSVVVGESTTVNRVDIPHVVMLDGDMRDVFGKLVRKGKYVIQDPQDPERIIEYTPASLAKFKARGNRV